LQENCRPTLIVLARPRAASRQWPRSARGGRLASSAYLCERAACAGSASIVGLRNEPAVASGVPWCHLSCHVPRQCAPADLSQRARPPAPPRRNGSDGQPARLGDFQLRADAQRLPHFPPRTATEPLTGLIAPPGNPLGDATGGWLLGSADFVDKI